MSKLTLTFKGHLLNIHHLEQDGDFYIGRDPACEIHIDSLAIEPRHARINVLGERSIISNLGPKDSLLINHHPSDEHALEDGDEIQLGKHALTYSREAAFIGSADNAGVRAFKPPGRKQIGWLQILSGANLGRTFPIDRAVFKLGAPDGSKAVIATTREGYFLSSLEGETPSVNDIDIGDKRWLLENGAIIVLGSTRIQFFLDHAADAAAAPETAGTFRHFSRIPFDTAVTLHGPAQTWRSRLIDLSLQGALIERPAEWQGRQGDAFTLDMTLDDGTIIRMEVTVAHAESATIGFHCDNIGLESISHLRRLIELNLGDPQLLNRELAALG
jgi:pSer/pThr/pTyr-binding forkhead associated (FHA) protein